MEIILEGGIDISMNEYIRSYSSWVLAPAIPYGTANFSII